MPGIRKAFTKEHLRAIEEAVARAERMTSGQIRVAIREDCAKGVSSVMEQARQDFLRYGLDNTRDHTGVLILVILNRRAVAVLGDKGINEVVPPMYWDSVVAKVEKGFKDGTPHRGLLAAVSEVGKILQKKFPKKPGGSNELSDEVITG